MKKKKPPEAIFQLFQAKNLSASKRIPSMYRNENSVNS